MGNRNSSEGAKGAIQAVIKQAETSFELHQLYQYIDLKGGGKLITAFRRAQMSKDFTEVENIIQNELRRFLYNNGNGKMVPVADLITARQESRQQTSVKPRNTPRNWNLCGWTPMRVKHTSQVGLMNESFSLNTLEGKILNSFSPHWVACLELVLKRCRLYY